MLPECSDAFVMASAALAQAVALVSSSAAIAARASTEAARGLFTGASRIWSPGSSKSGKRIYAISRIDLSFSAEKTRVRGAGS